MAKGNREVALSSWRAANGPQRAGNSGPTRGEDDAGSDIDFLVEFEPGSSLFDLLHLQDDLSELLGVPADVVSAGGLKPRDDHIRLEAIPL
ncbi:MAG TPA: nucleotidyltransferase domain-containing protein [Acidimicrobiia bacterium]|nr:nucleotidyltransferase domain-containing protein [Acidimicrobiia bacterium]